MNFYKRFPGDYRKKTARLTLAQHGVYSLLLDEYYLLEQALPADMQELYRICVAISKADQEAVRTVVDRFFPVGEDGLRHNERADEELEAAAPAVEAARENGKKGGRPKKPRPEPTTNPVGSSNTNPEETQWVSETITQTEPSAKPYARVPQSPEYREKENEERAHPTLTAAGRVGMALKRGGLQPGQWQPFDPRVIAITEAGYPSEWVEAVAREAVEKGKGIGWVKGALEGRQKDALAMAKSGANDVPVGVTQALLDRDPRPPWVIEAGFPNVWEAENVGCFAHTAHLFRNGRKVAT